MFLQCCRKTQNQKLRALDRLSKTDMRDTGAPTRSYLMSDLVKELANKEFAGEIVGEFSTERPTSENLKNEAHERLLRMSLIRQARKMLHERSNRVHAEQ